MINTFLTMASNGEPVYISTAHKAFQSLDKGETIHCLLSPLSGGKQQYFPLRIPPFGLSTQSDTFIKEYVWAELYNILSSLGGRKMELYVDWENEELVHFCQDLTNVFGITQNRKERRGYGRAINVNDRMLETLDPQSQGFHFELLPLSQMPVLPLSDKQRTPNLQVFSKVTENLEHKILCGIDVGGTDIKVVLVVNGKIRCYKEYDWFPSQFTQSKQLVEPICLLVNLMRSIVTLDTLSFSNEQEKLLKGLKKVLASSASEHSMANFSSEVEKLSQGSLVSFDGIGMCFPDVVIKNKIVGGEVYKTRGIRNNPEIEYESDFKTLTHLNDRLAEFVKEEKMIHIINDGPMASFTAAVEIAASQNPSLIANGVFAHTLGTELGTGWVDENGTIPDIPLEVYNFIIDLGSYPERRYHPDDLRSLNNFNTGLPGTLQKYASQSGVFRLAMKYFPSERPDLFQELLDKGFVKETVLDGKAAYSVPTEPEDMRKPFLEHMMELPEREHDEVNERIWKEMGEFLAVTLLETKKILNPATDSRILFGRVVKRKRCFELICEGARAIKDDIHFEVADSTLANTPLMKELEADKHYSVAQFAQAIGAVYFANQ